MPRIRSIKPEFFDSPDTAKAGPWARLLFIAMWSWADDYGIGTANLKELEGFAFPNDDLNIVSGTKHGTSVDTHGTSEAFRELVAEVSACFGVMLYKVRGRPYYCIPTWDLHQRNERRAHGRHPGPDEADETHELDFCNRSAGIDGTSVDAHGSSEQLRGSSGPGTGEQGNRGTGEQVKTPRAVARPPAKPDGATTRTPEWHATNDAYLDPRVNKGFAFVGIQKIVKQLLGSRGDPPEAITAAIVAVYETGRPITKQSLCQHLDKCHDRTNSGAHVNGMSRSDAKVADWLALANAPEPRQEIE